VIVVIQDPAIKERLLQEWHFVRRSQGMLTNRARVSFVGGIGMVGMYNEYYALLLVLGFSVLEHTLRIMNEQESYTRRSELKALMKASKKAGLPWQKYSAIALGRWKRNNLTHRQIIPTSKETFRILDEIEGELIGWNILPGPVEYQVSHSVTHTS
jgi:hypothetical protein